MVLQQELDGASQEGSASANPRDAAVMDLVSAVTRRMLPSLRLYSAWLLISHHILVNETNDMSLNVQVKQLWQTYATTLSLLLSTFPMSTLKPSQYLLEEDDDIAGFKPLMDISDSRRLGKELARGQERDHPNQEALARILFLIEDGIELCTPGTVPIEIKNKTFAFQDGIISTESNTGNAEYPTITLRDIPVNPSGVRATSTASRLGQANPMGSVISEPASTTLTNKMNAMVDDLVGSTHSREDSDDEEEVVLWKGRRAFYQSMQGSKSSISNQGTNTGTVTSKTPMVAQALSSASSGFGSVGSSALVQPQGKGKAPAKGSFTGPFGESVPDNLSGRPVYVGNRMPMQSQPRIPASLLTASDLVSIVQNYTKGMSLSQQGSGNPEMIPANMGMPQQEPVTPKMSSASLERPPAAHTSPLDYTPPGMATSAPISANSYMRGQQDAQRQARFGDYGAQHQGLPENARPRRGPQPQQQQYYNY
ncbi:hypothetical protein ABW19_dt0202870 [Dactylella cylindrospora]|nr:hypothetical protein ABW19_dt0202870 [Dactylella cylindrospora]